MRKSIVVSAFFPSSTLSEEALTGAIEEVALKAPSVDIVEFYYEQGFSPRVAHALERFRKGSLFLASVVTKRDSLDLASIDNVLRMKAVSKVKTCIDAARAYGSQAVLINTGFAPAASADRLAAVRALSASLETLLVYAADSNDPVDLFMETGAKNRTGEELIGPTKVATDFGLSLRKTHSNFFLTMDISHLLQLGEDPIGAIGNTAALTKHIHLANCVIRNPLSPLYGDMHPNFGQVDGEVSKFGARKIFEELKVMLLSPNTIVGLEIICRERDERGFFESVVHELGWFFGN